MNRANLILIENPYKESYLYQDDVLIIFVVKRYLNYGGVEWPDEKKINLIRSDELAICSDE